MQIQLDDGYQFGLGVFETICLINRKPVFLDWHLQRLQASLEFFHISQKVSREEVLNWLSLPEQQAVSELSAMKIMVSQENKVFAIRSNPYTEEKRKAGFCLGYSKILRNETSPLVFHKTMNYGDNILEKRRTHSLSIDEVLFCNTRGEICEGSTTNVFFACEGKIYTPALSCGLLPGIMRRYLLETAPVQEIILHPSDIFKMDECFVTNSLMGILPVKKLENQIFSDFTLSRKLQEQYFEELR